MTVTIIQRLWKEGSKTKTFIMKVLVIKTQINPTTYYIYGNKINKPKPSIIVIMIVRKNEPTPTIYCIYDNTKKTNNYWIPFIINVINDYHNNSKVVKGK